MRIMQSAQKFCCRNFKQSLQIRGETTTKLTNLFSFGYLAHFCSVIWRFFVRLFGEAGAERKHFGGAGRFYGKPQLFIYENNYIR